MGGGGWRQTRFAENEEKEWILTRLDLWKWQSNPPLAKGGE